jgi:predicted ATPase/class 3 adenylate cyclase
MAYLACRRTWCYRDAVQARARRGHAGAAAGHPTGRPGRSRTKVAVEAQRRAARLPTGTVTFLFTDIEGSTSAWIRNPNAMRVALARHDALIEGLVGEYGGQVVRPRGEGDSRFAVFGRATDGVAGACAVQVALVQEAWPLEVPLRVRMALHTGEADLRTGDYYGPAVNHCARLRAVAHGAQVLVSSVTADLVRESLAAEISLRDLGEHQLKDLERPEQVWQLVHPSLPTEFPPLGSLRTIRHNLPGQATAFIGRHQTIEAIKPLLSREGVRLLTLTGAGGIGKTRLALQIAGELVENFSDGAFFVPLAPIADPALVFPTIAQTVGVREVGGRPALQELKEQLRTKELLLVLDNFEHLLAAAPLVAELLESCPRVLVLATSRTVLRLARERVFEVPPLAEPDPQLVDPAVIGDYDAVKLFCERAQAVQADFALTRENARPVVDICHRLDGLPLAIELAAARVRLFAPPALLERLSSPLGLLTAGPRDVPVRHQTLRAAIAWSYDLLSSAEQGLLERLTVFAGGCTLEAAEAVADADGGLGIAVLDGVGALIDKSLLRRLDGKPGEPRFGLLETIREYALERLEVSGEAEKLRRTHADYFVALGEQAEAHLRGGPHFASWLDRLEPEQANLRTALRWCIERGDVERGLRLGGAVWRWWFERGTLAEGRDWLDHLLQLAHGSARDAYLAKALNGAGVLAYYQEDYETAQVVLEESRMIWAELGDSLRVGACLHNLASVAIERADYGAAKRLHEDALLLRHGDKVSAALTLSTLGWLHVVEGNYAMAREVSSRSAEMYSELGDELSAVWPNINLGWASLRSGNAVAGRAMFSQCLVFLRDNGHQPSDDIFGCLDGLAAMAAAQGEPERALRLAAAADHQRGVLGRPASRSQRMLLDSSLQSVRETIDPRIAAAAWTEGEALSLDEAIDYSLLDDNAQPAALSH